MPNGSILVTGGAGYIGSHVVQQLAQAGERVVVLDNLGRGFRQAVTAGEFIVGDVGDYALVSRLLDGAQVDTVMHFAAHTIVPESVAQPLKYYANNTCATRSLLQACADNGVTNFVFSSTAAVYGMPEDGYADEESPTRPINAYGTSKLLSDVVQEYRPVPEPHDLIWTRQATISSDDRKVTNLKARRITRNTTPSGTGPSDTARP